MPADAAVPVMPAHPDTENRRGWVRTMVLCVAVAMLEGLDIQAIGVAAPKLFPILGLASAQAGFIFSASTVGLCIGAVVGGRLADSVGRKRVLVGAVAVFGALSLLTPLTHGLSSLATVRFLTGLGLGGAMPNLIALVAENSPARWRVSLTTMMWAGTPLGGIIAAQVAAAAGNRWQAIFFVGGLAPLLLAPVMAIWLPESARFAKGTRATDPVMPFGQALFGGGRGLTTVLVWSGYFFMQLVLYLLLNWLPLLMTAQGFSRAQATYSAASYNAGGMVGGIAFGLLLSLPFRRVLLTAIFAGLALALFGLAAAGSSLVLSLGWAGLCGVFVIGGQYVLYGITPEIYPAAGRGTGVGAAVSFGRLGSVTGPILAGQLLSRHVAIPALLTGLVPLVVVAGMAILTVETRKARLLSCKKEAKNSC